MREHKEGGGNGGFDLRVRGKWEREVYISPLEKFWNYMYTPISFCILGKIKNYISFIGYTGHISFPITNN